MKLLLYCTKSEPYITKGTKIRVLSNNNGKIKSEVKTREQLIKEAIKELK